MQETMRRGWSLIFLSFSPSSSPMTVLATQAEQKAKPWLLFMPEAFQGAASYTLQICFRLCMLIYVTFSPPAMASPLLSSPSTSVSPPATTTTEAPAPAASESCHFRWCLYFRALSSWSTTCSRWACQSLRVEGSNSGLFISRCEV